MKKVVVLTRSDEGYAVDYPLNLEGKRIEEHADRLLQYEENGVNLFSDYRIAPLSAVPARDQWQEWGDKLFKGKKQS